MKREKTKAKKLATKAPTINMSAAYKEIAQHYVSTEMWGAIDDSLYMHGLEPTNSDAHCAIQLEAGQLTRIDSLIDRINQAIDHYGDLTIKEMPYHKDLDEVIENIYGEAADNVVHIFMDADDADDADKYLMPMDDVVCPGCGTNHSEGIEEITRKHAECADCDVPFADDEDSVWYNGVANEDGDRDGEMLCWDCFEARPNVWSVCCQGDDGHINLVKGHLFDSGITAKAAGKALSELNKGRLFMVSDAKGTEPTTRYIEDIPLVMPEVKADAKPGTFTQLAMFAGGLLGAGIANAANAAMSAPGVRVAEPVDMVEEVVEAVGKEAVA